MATTDDLTTLVCLFHHNDQAQAAIKDLLQAGIPQSSISVFDNKDSETQTSDSFQEMGIPDRDRSHLLDSLRKGGALVSVSATRDETAAVEKAFGAHRAKLIDEADRDPGAYAAAPEEGLIPVVAEELVVGKRTVDQGGVRVYRRVIEIPVDESVTLHDEHVNVQRTAVDRPVTEADLALQGARTIELTETAEEAVVSKTARVVEEVTVGKTESERIEHIHDTVRHTEVDVEELAPAGDLRAPEKRM